MSSVSPQSSASQVSVQDCLSLAPPVAPSFIARDGPMSGPELELAKLYYSTLQRYYDAVGVMVPRSREPSVVSESVRSVTTASSGRGRRACRRGKRRGNVGLASAVDGYCYEPLLDPGAAKEAVQLLGPWPTLGRLMSLPLDMLRSVGDLSANMCTLEAGSIHMVEGCDGYSFKQVVQQAAVGYRTAVGTLGTAWLPCDSGLSVGHGLLVGGGARGPGAYWDASYEHVEGSVVDFSRATVVDVEYRPISPSLGYVVCGYRQHGEVTAVFCKVDSVDAEPCSVAGSVGAVVIAAYSLSCDGQEIFRYDCMGRGELALNMEFERSVPSRYFVYTIRSSDRERVLGDTVREYGWKFEPAVRDRPRERVESEVSALAAGFSGEWAVTSVGKSCVSVWIPVAGGGKVLGLVSGQEVVGVIPVVYHKKEKGFMERVLRFAVCPHGGGFGHCCRHAQYRALWFPGLSLLDRSYLESARVWSPAEMLRAFRASLRMSDQRLDTVASCLYMGRA